MTARTVRYLVAGMMLLTVCAATSMTVDTKPVTDSISTVAARYHLRSRTSDFYRRASTSAGAGARR